MAFVRNKNNCIGRIPFAPTKKMKPTIIGITGGIGGGKSTLSAILREHGYFVYDTDSEAKRLQNEHPEIRQQLTAVFGNEIYNSAGQLDRKRLADTVFENPVLLMTLNKIIHPIVRQDFRAWQKRHAQEKFLFVESAILFESGLNELIDKAIVVTAPEEIRISRVAKRDGVTHEQVRARMTHQMPEDEKIKRADIVIDSHNENLQEQVNEIIEKLKIEN